MVVTTDNFVNNSPITTIIVNNITIIVNITIILSLLKQVKKTEARDSVGNFVQNASSPVKSEQFTELLSAVMSPPCC